MTEEEAKPLPLYMAEAAGLYEFALQSAWNQLPPRTELRLSNGTACRIVSHGEWNHSAGPDFKNAVIEFSGGVRRGDIELHCRTSDWISHGHADDPAYQNLILHVVDQDDTSPANVAFLPDVPLLVLPPLDKLQTTPASASACARYFQRMEDAQISKFLEDAGLTRMREKSASMLHDMIAGGTWQTFHCRFLDLLGIPGNREAFRILAERVFRYPEEILRKNYTALLWGESGLLPDPAATPGLSDEALQLVRSRWDQWWKLRHEALDPISYRRNCRPLNSVERRIALADAFVRIFSLDPFPKLFDLLRQDNIQEVRKTLEEMFLIRDPFWSRHTSFTSKELQKETVLFGKARVTELLTDLLCPALHAVAALKKDARSAARIESLYLALPKTESNRTLKTMEEACFPGRGAGILRSSAAQQGLIHLYRTACEPLSFDCGACPIYRSFQA